MKLDELKRARDEWSRESYLKGLWLGGMYGLFLGILIGIIVFLAI